jgi:hypothetical protein
VCGSPIDRLKITYTNDLPAKPRESCAIKPCMDMTNLHFHGPTGLPESPQDEVLTMMAMPGQRLGEAKSYPAESELQAFHLIKVAVTNPTSEILNVRARIWRRGGLY